MLPSKKFLSLPIISLKEGQQIGFVRNLVVDPKIKAIAAFIVDPKGFFKEQRIIPFNRVVSIGENAITVSTESQVEKATNLPDIMELLKEKAAVIGIKVVTADGKILGITDEFYINPEDGTIASLDISDGRIEGLFNGKARLPADDILTVGSDVIVVTKGCEERLETLNKGINENFKSFFQAASSKAAEKSHQLNTYWKNKTSKDSPADSEEAEISPISNTLEDDTPDELSYSEIQEMSEEDKKDEAI